MFRKSYGAAVICGFCLLLLAMPLHAGVVFDGVDDRIATSSSIAVTGSITISAWINSNSISVTSQYIISDLNTNNKSNYEFLKSGLTKIEFIIRTPTIIGWISTNSVVANGSWYHVCITYNGSTTPIFYVNGTPVSVTQTFGSGNPPLGASGNIVYIGNYYGYNLGFSGTISQLAIWQSVLTPTQIALLAGSRHRRMPQLVDPTDLKLYLPLDDAPVNVTGNGRTFYDLSGLGYNGTGSWGANLSGCWIRSNTPVTKINTAIPTGLVVSP